VSFTQANHVFASVDEAALNVLLHAVCTARPHYLNYGSALFVPVSTVSATNMDPIPFPGVPGGIQYQVEFAIPSIDLFPPDAAPSPLPPGPNQFTVKTTVTLTLGCLTWQITGGNRPVPPQVSVNPVQFALDVWARGAIVSQYFGPGTGFIVFRVDDVRMPDIRPAGLETVLDCLVRMMLQAALANLQLPLNVVSMGAFQLILQRGPVIDADQVEVWGDI
jgi:hypothetical protein